MNIKTSISFDNNRAQRSVIVMNADAPVTLDKEQILRFTYGLFFEATLSRKRIDGDHFMSLMNDLRIECRGPFDMELLPEVLQDANQKATKNKVQRSGGDVFVKTVTFDSKMLLDSLDEALGELV